MIARRAIPDDDHVSRFVPKNRQDRDPETDEFRGLTIAACQLRTTDNGGLSVTWIEHFGPYGQQAKRDAAVAYRASLSSGKLPPQAAFAYAEVSRIKAAARQFDKAVRVVWDPVEGNPGHAEVRHFADDDLRLLDLLSTETFIDPDFVREMNLPTV